MTTMIARMVMTICKDAAMIREDDHDHLQG